MKEPPYQNLMLCKEGSVSLGLTLKPLADVGRVAQAEFWLMFDDQSGGQLEVCGMSAPELRSYAKVLIEGAEHLENFNWIQLVEESDE